VGDLDCEMVCHVLHAHVLGRHHGVLPQVKWRALWSTMFAGPSRIRLLPQLLRVPWLEVGMGLALRVLRKTCGLYGLVESCPKSPPKIGLERWV
jgi:hypothetical protein